MAGLNPAVEEGDVLFHPPELGKNTFDGHLAYTQALALAPAGGIAAELKQDADLVVLLQKVLNCCAPPRCQEDGAQARSEEHTSELQSLMRISYAVFCLKKKKNKTTTLH